ncbi:response regulator [Hahella sp. SMD15-11]|uniref:Response regulator n=1 Tax=Thermohahella caldifontis TaxID=3142973 RepID=A0AB39UXT5_9GAMM
MLELMGGRLLWEPREDSESGNRYLVSLPVIVKASGESIESDTGNDVRLQGHVLVVEDNLVNQKVIMGLLRHLGLTCQACYNGREALTLWSKGRYDLILMDCQMPVMDGIEATKMIRRQEALEGRPHTPVIALTANALDGAEDRCRAAGMDAFLAKPVKRQVLARVLGEYLAPLPGLDTSGAMNSP